MPLRSGASGDPTSLSAPPPPPVPFTGSPAPPASTAAAQLVKKAGRSAASQERRGDPEDLPESTSSSYGKKARLVGPDRGHIDDDMRSADERKAEVPNDTRPSSAPAALHPPVNAPAVTPPSSSSSSSASSPSPASSSSGVPAKMPNIVPVWASSKRLDEAKVDFRVPTELFVELTVDKRACRAPSVMSRMYREGAASKCSAAAALLGDSKEEGFRVVAPVLPRAMLAADAATVAQWSEPQQAWYTQLGELVREHGSSIRESQGAPEQRSAALLSVFKLVNPEQVSKLWPQPAMRTSTWKDLLILPTAILQDRPCESQRTQPNGLPRVKVPEHSFRLRLSCATVEVSFVVACCIANYALLACEEKGAHEHLRAILNGCSTPVASADTSVSEGDSSDSDGEWRTQHPHREAARQRRRTVARGKRLAAFITKRLCGERFKADSANPLLQMATRVGVRPWQHHFLECSVSQWHSVGCPSIFDVSDVAFVRATTAVPALQDARTACWHLRQQVGGTQVSLFVREDLVSHLPGINIVLRQHPELSEAALRVVGDVHPYSPRGRGERGRSVPWERRRVCFTPEAVPVTDRQPVSAVPSSSSRVERTSAPPSWAAALSASRPIAVPAARRPAPSAPLDQRPRKDQRREPSTVSTPPSTAATAAHTVSTVSPAPWRADITAIQARLDRLESKWDQLLDLPRQIRSLEHKLDAALSRSQAPSACSAPLSRNRARVAPTVATDLTGHVGELSGEVTAQGRLMARLLANLHAFMPEVVEAVMQAPRERGGDMSDDDGADGAAGA